MKRAIAYTSDILLMRTREVITREAQKEAIRKHAVENGIDIVEWCEDEMYNENVLARPGVQKLIASLDGCDMVLVERVWSLSRNMAMLENLFVELDRKEIPLEAAKTTWDCVSQKCRRRFRTNVPRPERAGVIAAREEAGALPAGRPERIGFAVLKEKLGTA